MIKPKWEMIIDDLRLCIFHTQDIEDVFPVVHANCVAFHYNGNVKWELHDDYNGIIDIESVALLKGKWVAYGLEDRYEFDLRTGACKSF